ncbi:uncharacterized protein LOC117175624 [Belonocnema kinseyi]|uniref:uncharacterized protein LOC117175624 n=1 Tax=Belonocnema kinseyi TaxID=2817044 RepID=UPI00143D5B57|nr:uncharacterized protein LOC117175624 [Belonocnema kinseyi]
MWDAGSYEEARGGAKGGGTKIPKKWDEWEEFWKGEKDKVWQKIESLENQQKEFNETRIKELRLIEERMIKIEESVERKQVELTASQDTSEVRVGVRVENERLRNRLLQIEKHIEGEERAKRKKTVMVKGLKVNSETGEEEVKKLMKDIGAKIRVEGVQRVGRMREGREGMFLVT